MKKKPNILVSEEKKSIDRLSWSNTIEKEGLLRYGFRELKFKEDLTPSLSFMCLMSKDLLIRQMHDECICGKFYFTHDKFTPYYSDSRAFLYYKITPSISGKKKHQKLLIVDRKGRYYTEINLPSDVSLSSRFSIKMALVGFIEKVLANRESLVKQKAAQIKTAKRKRAQHASRASE